MIFFDKGISDNEVTVFDCYVAKQNKHVALEIILTTYYDQKQHTCHGVRLSRFSIPTPGADNYI